MKLSDFFAPPLVVRDAEFEHLGRVDSAAPGTLAFADAPVFARIAADNPNVSALIVPEHLLPTVVGTIGATISREPRSDFYRVHERLVRALQNRATPPGPAIDGNCSIHPTAIISGDCTLGEGCSVGEYAVIRGPAAIGRNCFIDAHASIGVEGLLWREESGRRVRIPHGGAITIGDGACILANAVIVRSVHMSRLTRIGSGAQIGISTTIGHDADIGEGAVVSGNCVVARGARIGDRAWIGAGSTIREYLNVGECAQIKAGSTVIEDVAPGGQVSGNFAYDHNRRLLRFAATRRGTGQENGIR